LFAWTSSRLRFHFFISYIAYFFALNFLYFVAVVAISCYCIFKQDFLMELHGEGDGESGEPEQPDAGANKCTSFLKY